MLSALVTSKANDSLYATAYLHHFQMVSIDVASSTVIVPSLPTLSIASALISPIVNIQLAETVCDLRDLRVSVDTS